jgi:hypothetical protein
MPCSTGYGMLGLSAIRRSGLALGKRFTGDIAAKLPTVFGPVCSKHLGNNLEAESVW